jgi:tetratricopeptide (TPR) repeat protein
VSVIFISHASADDGFVADLRQRLEALQIRVWVDSRQLRGGSKLAPEIETAITQASHFVAVLSPATVNSPWVRREINKALEVEKDRQGDGFRVIPVLLPGITPGALELWFPEEPVAVPVEVGPGGLSAALPGLLAALGERLPTDFEPLLEPDTKPVEELVLSLVDPHIETVEGKRRAKATATVVYQPAGSGVRDVESRRFEFIAPLGPIETADLSWYLESYYQWPVGVFRRRAERIEARLPGWGRDLHTAALGVGEAREAVASWEQAAVGGERRFSVEVDSDLPAGATKEAEAAALEAASELLGLPWELLHDGRGWLFQGRDAVRVRRRLPNRFRQEKRASVLPVRILLVTARPEKDGQGNRIGYLDHRVSALPLVEAVESLGDLAELTVLQPATYAALEQALRDGDQGSRFDVVHFDGHGVYDRRLGLGGLCFEDPADQDRWEQRSLDFVDAVRLAGLVREHRVPLVFLEACQTAVAEVDPTASVAARLLTEGVASVVAMTHSVLVETSRRFVHGFYGELARGARVGSAMLAGQQVLFADPSRGRVLGAGVLELQDWFVPVLYQEEQDPQLVTKIPPQDVQQLEVKKRRLSLGELPEPPQHHFQGRSRELLALERLLYRESWAVVRGSGGQGKTTLAVELARWLVRTGRFGRAGFVSLEHYRDAKAVVDTLGRQLVDPDYSVAEYPDLDQAVQPLERALADQPTIVVVDNCESVLPERGGPVVAPGPGDARDVSAEIFDLCRRLLEADPRTRVVFTSRELLPAPFDHPGRVRELGALDQTDAVELVGEVMKLNGWMPPGHDSGDTPEQISDLVEAVNRHARALVLLAGEVARGGVKATTDDLRALMAHLEQQHPGDRENSLYASVELSLRRLTAESRQQVRALAVCHGGVHLVILSMLTGLEQDAANGLAAELIDIGLAEDMGDGHLRLDPGLAPYLLGELTVDDTETLRTRWADAMAQLTDYLYGQLFEDAQLASRLTVLELPNLLDMLDWLQTRRPPEQLVTLASNVEALVAPLGRPQALARAIRVREQAARQLGDWSHASYLAETANIDRLLDRGDPQAAHSAAQQLLAKTQTAGETAYPGAAYDTALAHMYFGRVLQMGGAAEAALVPLAEARRRFQQLADAGDKGAERMVAATLTDTGDCYAALGRFESAAEAYQEAIRREGMDDRRGAAVDKTQLATVRLLQRRYDEALKSYEEARDTFQALGEPRSVATVWHQIGRVYQEAGQLEASEQAFRQSLAIKVRENNLPGQASTLNQLGNLYSLMDRDEEAVTFLKQAAEIYVKSGDLAAEGTARYNLASTLLNLARYEEARQELQRAIECDKPYGHAAQPWKTWATLQELEQATGHPEDAHAPRNHAIETYLAYRRAGGDSQSNQFPLFSLVVQAVLENTQDQAVQELNDLLEPDDPATFTALIRQLQAILAGNRDPNLAADPELDYKNAVELRLLLDTLNQANPDQT